MRSLGAIDRCDLILAVFDGTRGLTEEDRSVLQAAEGRTVIGIINKSDAGIRISEEDREYIAERTKATVELSALTGDGSRKLGEAIAAAVGLANLDSTAAMLANTRQFACAARARDALTDAHEALVAGQTFDAVSVCIEEAINALLELTGKNASMEIIDRAFENFCVGK